MAASEPCDDFDAAVREHDARVAALGVEIWVGSEPTFTDRLAQTPEWLHEAIGGDKCVRAQQLVTALARTRPGAVVLRTVGRQYPGEDRPRWNFGLYARRGQDSTWSGPPDPMLATAPADVVVDLVRWREAFAASLAATGFAVLPEPPADVAPGEDAAGAAGDPGTTGAATGGDDLAGTEEEEQDTLPAAVPSAQALLAVRVGDETRVFRLRAGPVDGVATARVDLPPLPDVGTFLAVLAAIDASARAAGLATLVIGGASPPADASVEFTTVTPDPAVIEVNSAPSADATDFLRLRREIEAAAAGVGLAPYRLYFNGTVADSGGGGQITLGGRRPEASVFVAAPRLLPALVTFLNRHPALSYLYAHDYVGPGGQSVRADERGTDAFDELALALRLLARNGAPAPGVLWRCLAPFLCDALGNGHRAEINVEKLWNPTLPGRGQQGLVEFRALRMQHGPERATALACLLRAIVATLVRDPRPQPLADWGRALHQRFALPFYLERDLDAVLAELDAAGLGLGGPLVALLRREEFRFWGRVALPDGCALEVRRAVEFWPLLGDAATPEQGRSSRLVDASTARIEIRLRSPDAAKAGTAMPVAASCEVAAFEAATCEAATCDAEAAEASGAGWRDWHVRCAGVALPLRAERDECGELGVSGLRYRSFVPAAGLHPTLPAQVPVRLVLWRDGDPGFELTLHEWRPDGDAYPGLPEDLADAARRRAERLTLTRREPDVGESGDRDAAGSGVPASARPGGAWNALDAAVAKSPIDPGDYCLDLRALA